MLVLEIMTYKGEGENKVPDLVMIDIVDAKDKDRTSIKHGKKNGLQEAFELGLIWLDVELKKSEQ